MMKSCLIVDDSKVIRMVAKKILQELNFRTEEAQDGQIASEICRKFMPNAVLLDWNMPIMNGLEFLQKLRALLGGDKPVVVFCTTENDIEAYPAGHRGRGSRLPCVP
ncbi:MAG: two-component system chemotaxis family response regulator CheY [Rhodospirillaceae bacterium]|nr:MAG: two-component system chemotaxis family response regulator CheY [Rhodospirillaceae bacterium]